MDLEVFILAASALAYTGGTIMATVAKTTDARVEGRHGLWESRNHPKLLNWGLALMALGATQFIGYALNNESEMQRVAAITCKGDRRCIVKTAPQISPEFPAPN